MKKSRLICGLLALVGLLLTMAPAALAKTVTLAWDRSTESTVVGYKIYYRADSSSLPFTGIGAAEGNSPLNVGSSVTATLSSLDDSKSYYFAVVAYDANGIESSYSNIVNAPGQSCTDEDGDGFAVEGGVCGDVDPDDYDPLIPDSGITPLDDTSEFAKQLYRDILNREGDSSGVSYWANQIDSAKSTKSQAAETFLHSDEHQYRFASIARLYLAYFRRSPDFNGLMYWVTSYGQGLPLEEISLAFAEAQEFQSTYGNLDNGSFIDLIYQNVLGREPDAQGLAFWTKQLDTGILTRGQVMIGFSESEEYKAYCQTEIFVSTAFNCLVRRAPSQTEYNSWVSSLKSGNSKLKLMDTLLNSSEYAARFGN